jgi:hypothetical protein
MFINHKDHRMVLGDWGLAEFYFPAKRYKVCEPSSPLEGRKVEGLLFVAMILLPYMLLCTLLILRAWMGTGFLSTSIVKIVFLWWNLSCGAPRFASVQGCTLGSCMVKSTCLSCKAKQACYKACRELKLQGPATHFSNRGCHL